MDLIKKIAGFILIFPLLSSISFAAQTFQLQYQIINGQKIVKPWDYPTRPKIGVALSGGLMVRGLMHLGVIEALQEEGIPIDYISGTSMGAILGAFVANGYSTEQIKQMLSQINWGLMMSDDLAAAEKTARLRSLERRYAFSMELDQNLKPALPLGLSQGHYALTEFNLLLDRATLERNFDRFPIPYRAVMVNLSTGEEKIVSSGYIAEVLRASSSVPLMFAPMEIDGQLYIDGGILNNFPTDVVKNMGADFVIGSNILSPLTRKEEFKSFAQVLSQTLKYPVKDRIEQNRKLADILVEPDLSAYGAADFSKISEISNVGHNDIKPKLEVLKSKLQKAESDYLETHRYQITQIIYPENSVTRSEKTLPAEFNEKEIYQLLQKLNSPLAVLDQSTLKISIQSSVTPSSQNLADLIIQEIEIKGATPASSELIKSRLSDLNHWDANPERVQKKLDELYATGRFHLIYPRWDRMGQGVKLTVVVQEKQSNSLRVGAKLDNEEGINILANLDLNRMGFFQFQNNLEVGIGERQKLEWNLQWFPSVWDHYIAFSAQFYARDRQIKFYDPVGRYIDTYRDGRLGVQAGVQFGITQFDTQTLALFTEKINYRHFPAPSTLDTNDDKNGLIFKTAWDVFPKNGSVFGYQLGGEVNQFSSTQLNQSFTKSSAEAAFIFDFNFFQFFARSDIGMSSASLPLYEQYYYGGEGKLAGYHPTELQGNSYAGIHALLKARLFAFDLGFLKRIDSKLFYDRASVNALPSASWNNALEGWGVGFEAQSLGNLTAKLNFEFAQANRNLVYLAFGNEF